MTKSLREFAETIVNDPVYRQSIVDRARAGTLDPMIEVMLLECFEGRTSLGSIGGELTSPLQSRTLAFVRPSEHAIAEERIRANVREALHDRLMQFGAPVVEAALKQMEATPFITPELFYSAMQEAAVSELRPLFAALNDTLKGHE